MSVVKFDARRPRARQQAVARRSDRTTAFLAAVALVAVLALGWVLADRFVLVETPAVANRISTITAGFAMCGRERHTCVVDGDTICLNGQNLRMQGYDTPEPHTDVCGGAAEVALAKRASARLLALLNAGPFTVETFGVDGTGERTLATIRIDGRDVGVGATLAERHGVLVLMQTLEKLLASSGLGGYGAEAASSVTITDWKVTRPNFASIG